MNYIRENVTELKTSNPAQAFNTLKRMGAPPGQFEDKDTFTLQSHENLSVPESAEKVLNHFCRISQEFSPLHHSHLPDRVVQKLDNPESESCAPNLSPHEVYKCIKSARKPKSGVSIGF